MLCIGVKGFHEELVADATLSLPARNMHNAEAEGKTYHSQATQPFTPYSIVNPGVEQLVVARSDVHGSATQLYGRSRLDSLEQVVSR